METSIQITEVEKKIKEGSFKTKPNQSTKRCGKFWISFERIYDEGDKLVEGCLICRICKKILKYDSKKGISNLNNHSAACIEPKRTLKSFIERENIIKSEHKRELCLQAVVASVKDTRTFNLTDCSGVVNLLHCAWNLGAKIGVVSKDELVRSLPCPTTVSRNVNRLAENSKENMKLKLKTEVESGTTFAFTTDIGQDKYKRTSYLCITMHYFDRKTMALVDFILACKPLEFGKKKDNIYLSQIISDTLNEYDLLQYRENLVFISDRGGNIRLALNNYVRLNCFPHFCHNIAKYGCAIDSTKKVIDNCASLVKYFKFNGLNNILEVSLKSAISTRFNYVYMMLNSIDNQWNAIEEILAQRRELRRIANIDREYIQGIVRFLNTINLASKHTESTYKDTLAHVWIGITEICSKCRVQPDDPIYIRAIKARCLEYIESKFVLHQYHRIASFLHPNYKTLIFASPEQKNKTIRETKELLNRTTSSQSSISSSSSSPSNSSSRRSSTESDSSFLSNYYNRCDDEINEVDAYLNVDCIPDENINVFIWWLERKSTFPELYKIALKMHSIPASSLQSERTYSRAGTIISDRRTSLNPRTVEDLLMLNKNGYDHK